jgi:DNA-directed RNA polymerase specialized sigma24 family protein
VLLEDLDGASPDRDPEKVTAIRELLRLVLERLREELSPLGRHLFELLFIQGLSTTETMAVTGMSADAVYAWKSRLRRLVQEILDDLSGK